MDRLTRPLNVESQAPALTTGMAPDTPIPSDLVWRAQQGDRQAFAEIFTRSVHSITRYVGAILQDAQRTEDAVGQTYLDAWRQLPRLREPERFSAWILRVAHNRAVDELRRPDATPIDDVPDQAAPAATEPEAVLMRSSNIDAVRAAILDLPDDHREVVTLRHLQGLSHAEVARQMGRSEDASRALLHRAMLGLRRRLQAD